MPAKKLACEKEVNQSYRLKLSIQYAGSVRIAPLTERGLRAIAKASLESNFDVTIRFVPRAEAQALNHSYRARSYTPNVLTFSYLPQASADIVICTPVVREQAKEQGKTFAGHLAHLVVHGMLHAQGYDHQSDCQARAMESREQAILAGFGIADPYRVAPK
ncbi:MAG: rRNA maturation RNase YbeY [Burkholderiaceae bacterium]